MIGTVIWIGFANLRRDRVAQLLTFLLPIVFFSIFAVVFGGRQTGNRTPKVAVAVADEDGTELSRRLVAGLRREPSLEVRTTVKGKGATKEAALTRQTAEHLVRVGDVPVAIVLPKGLRIGFPGAGTSGGELLLLADPSDPIAVQMVQGLLQKVAMTSLPDLMMGDGIASFERYAGALTPEQRQAVDGWLPRLRQRASTDPSGAVATDGRGGEGFSGLVATKVVDVMRQGGQQKGMVAFYAAGVGVMFLLFTCSGAGGALLEEVESGTLDRVLSTRLGMGGLLLGKWLYLALLGFVQLTVMFTYGAIVFGLDLVHHLAGFALMTAVTAAAAAGFGLLLATACRSRAQLGGLSTTVILVMSAIGGSMFPRFLMPEGLQKFGLLTFNAWALDGYLKVFWRELPILSLWPQLAVLAALAVTFLAAARALARRWERV
jgi:ABC-2 type transport system permease protein